MEKISTDMADDGLRKMAKGTVRFSIKADDTLENFHVHESFREFCRIECDNNYTMGLRKLLEHYEKSNRDETIFGILNDHANAICAIQEEVDSVKSPQPEVKSKENEKKGTF